MIKNILYYGNSMGRGYQGDKLYWRILRNGKYTWKKAEVVEALAWDGVELIVRPLQEEEE